MIHVIHGAPCSGKSTYIREHAKAGDLIVDLDEITKAIGVPDHDYSKTAKPDTLYRIREALIADAVACRDEFDSWIVDTMLAGNYPEGTDIIEMDADKDTCLARATADGRPQKTFDGIEKYFADEKGNSMEHLVKSFEMKAADNGKIAGYFSTYEKTPDSYGDIITPGAFTKTLEKRKATGHPFPLCFNHDFDKVIGTVDLVEERENGPYIEASFLDTQLAQDVRKYVQSGAVYQFSFAYDVLKAREPNDEEKANGVTNVLEELEVFEISVVTVPANQNAVVTDVKSVEPETKAGRRNRKSDEEIIRTCIKSLESLLDEGGEDKPTEEEAGKEAEPEVNATAEEPEVNGNLEKASALLEKIKSYKGGST